MKRCSGLFSGLVKTKRQAECTRSSEPAVTQRATKPSQKLSVQCTAEQSGFLRRFAEGQKSLLRRVAKYVQRSLKAPELKHSTKMKSTKNTT